MTTGSGVERTGGEWVVEALRAEGVRHVFGIPGVHNLAIYDALLRGGTGITHILARHEQGAAFMADGYARASGRPGVIVATTGPGATNVLTPLVESYAGSQPVLALVSDIPAALIGRDLGALHEVPNQIDCFRPVTRWAETIHDGSAFATAIQRAFEHFRSARPGPVALSLPTDLLTARVGSRINDPTGRPPVCDRGLIAQAAERLSRAQFPVIVTGGGTVSAGAEDELRALAGRLGAPVITTVMGRGAMPEDDPLWVGVLSNKYASQPLLEAADVVLAVGCRFAHRSTQGLLLNLRFRPEQVLIHLDIDPSVIGKLFPATLGMVGDARDGLAALLEALGPGAPAARWPARRLADLRAARSPRWEPETGRLIEILRAALPADAIVVNDQTGINYWMEWHFPVLTPRTFLYPVGSATLGYAVPAAIGAKVAMPERPVVAVVGDGGFMFSVNELATAVKYGLGIVFLVLNDERFGAIKYLQQAMFGGRWGEADLANPDFVALARAFHANGRRAQGLDDLGPALKQALGRPGPTVLELPLAVLPPWEI
jgi:thiamine pyrophosphate-dependent acetolactate synthase large subunit-like protein